MVVVSSVVVLSLVVEEPLSLLHEIMVRLKRNMEKMMSMCFAWFPIWWFRRTQCIPRFGGVLQCVGDFTGMVSDCEEVGGGYSQEML